MDSIKTGGGAFPNTFSLGLTMRDYFAAAALAEVTRNVGCSGWRETSAWNAYSLADAMLREREKETRS